MRLGPGIHDGRRIRPWDLMVCNTCYDSNREGLVPERHPKLFDYLQTKGIEAKLNNVERLDWPRRDGE